MNKFNDFALGIVAGVVLFSILMIGDIAKTHIERTDELEQKEAKIEALQEENSLLHDEVFNLNQALMKENE